MIEQLELDYHFFLDQTQDVIIFAEIERKAICYWNHMASVLYGIDEHTASLEHIFECCPQTLDEMIEDMISSRSEEDPVTFFPQLYTMRKDGEEQLVDLTISYANIEQTILCFKLCQREDTRMTVAKEMIHHGVKPVFLSNLNEELDIFYANELFYTTFTKGKEAFERYYKNSFASTLLDLDTGAFFRKLKKNLLEKKSFRQDVQISTVHGVKKWFLLELQIIHIGKNDIKILGSLLPIAERIEIANRLSQMRNYLVAIQELTSGALFYIDPETKKASHHSPLLQQAGFPFEMDGFPKCVIPMLHPDDVPNFLEFTEKMMEGEIVSHEVRYRKGADLYSWSKLSSLPIRNEEDEITEIVGRIMNIDNEVELIKQATVDPLTNTLNKEYVKDSVESVLNGTVQTEGEITRHALFFMDLDNFKDVNDNHGHQFGDFLLKELGKRLGASVRAGDIIGRVGGDEFIFLIRNIPNMAMLREKAKRLLNTIAEEFNDGNESHYIGGSVGIAVFPEHGTSYDELYQKADKALYRSKKRGKNMATIYKEDNESPSLS